MSWTYDKSWGEEYNKEIKCILGMVLFQNASVLEDVTFATDIKIGATSIAVRMRRSRWLGKSDEFTIRWKRPSGAKTECQKIMEGYGDFLFYGFESECGRHVGLWKIIDLELLRKTRRSENSASPEWSHDYLFKTETTRNGEIFFVFKEKLFPCCVVVASGVGLEINNLENCIASA